MIMLKKVIMNLQFQWQEWVDKNLDPGEWRWHGPRKM